MPEGADDEPPGDPEVLFRATQSAQRSLDGLHQRESLYDIQNRRVSDLDVANPVIGRVFRQLVGDSLERFFGLHYRNGHVEPLEVILQGLRVIHSHEVGQLLRRVLGHLDARLAREIQKRRRSNGAIEMAVELRLRELAELAGEDRERHYNELKSDSSTSACRARTMRKIAPFCTGLSLAAVIPLLSVIMRSPLRTASACPASHASTAWRAVADASTS